VSEGQDWARLDRLLEGALEQPRERREAWLVEACPDDEGLRARVASLVQLAQEDGDGLTPGGGLKGSIWDSVAGELDREGGLSIVPGSRLGPYEIRGVLGAGGMGRVYRAYDPGLDRDVAIKALFRDLTTEETSLRRFEREAKLLATLSHPNIASIYGFHVFDGRPYLVLELVEGETLDEILARQALPWERAVPITRQVAEALEEAHGKGIVHRDLKPSNVKVSRGGRVKVLDFGIARRLGPRANGGVASATLTQEGAVLGTAAYMSPEQARGEAVDERTDVWALGCLLYEMLAGRRAFEGRTVSDLLASVLRDEVDRGALPPQTPAALVRLLQRCLRKDPRRRFQHVGDVRLELEELEGGLETTEGGARAERRRSHLGVWLPWAVAALGGLAAIAAFLSRPPVPGGPASEPGLRQFVLDLPSGVTMARGDYASPVALSPDGSTIVLLGEEAGVGRLFHRRLEELDWTALPETEGAWQPFFSADGREVGFFAQRMLRRVALDGTTPVSVTEVGRNPRGATWTPDGTIVYGPSQTSGLLRVDARGGTPRPLTELDSTTDERSHRWPQVLPDGRSVLFTVDFMDSTFDDAALELVSLETGERRTVLEGGAHGRYVPSGHIVYARGGRLFAVPFDAARGRVTGTPVLVLDGIAYDLRNGGTKLAVANDGSIAYVPGMSGSVDRHLVWVDVEGRREPATRQPRRLLDPRLSPDGERVAIRIGDPAASDLWTLDLATGTVAQVTFGLHAFRPTWTPDGRSLTVGVSETTGWRLVTVDAKGQGNEVALHESPNRLYPGTWSPDGRTLVFEERDEESGWDILALEVDAEGRPVGEPRPLVATPANETNPALSPDGSSLAYESDEQDGLVEIYVRPYGRPGESVKITTGGGRWPRWGRRGELFYWSSFTREMHRVTHHTEGRRFVVSAEETVWSADDEPLDVPLSEFLGRGFDLDPRGPRFLMLVPEAAQEAPAPRIILAQNWVRELLTRGIPAR
jgi:Tol biopolymer transport system component